MEQLNLTEKRQDELYILEAKGSLNSYTYVDFQTKAFALAAKGNLVVDMSEVTNLSSAGLGVLMSLKEESEAAGFNLHILRPSEIVRLAISSTGFSDMFDFIGSVSELNR